MRKYSKAFLESGDKNLNWIKFLQPKFNLTPKEVELGGLLLKYYKEIECKTTDVSYINQILFSTEYRRKAKEAINVTDGYFDVLLYKLRKNNVIINNTLNPQIIPEPIEGTGLYGLLVYFEDKK